MSMAFGAPFLPNLLSRLIHKNERCKIEVSIAMLDPEWDALGCLNPDWPDQAAAAFRTLARHAEALMNGVSMKIQRYRYTPNLHGFAIDDALLYVSVCSWRGGVLQGAENPYVLLRKGQGDEFSSTLSDAFNGWFQRAFREVTLSGERGTAASRE